MKLAYLGHPHAGGTYSVFCHLRSALAPTGVELRWLGGGGAAHAAVAAPCWAADLAFGHVAGNGSMDERCLSLALMRAIEQERFDGVLVNVLTGPAEMNLARYLPSRILRLMLVHNITPGTYAAAHAIRDHVHATIGVSQRIRHDLVHRHGFDGDRTVAIPTGIEFPFPTVPRPVRNRPLRLVYLGRIEDAAKGVFFLPRILDGLDPRISLTIAGDGPDLPALRGHCARLGGRIAFLGEVRRELVPELLAAHDALLMPSRYEGLPLSLLEAMAAGCVPVATRLPGVTDTAVTDGQDGCLFPSGSIRVASRAVAFLDANPAALRRMSLAAVETARTRFSVAQMAERYAAVFDAAKAWASPLRPLDAANWRVPSGMRPGLRTLLPAPAKAFLRTMRERMAV
jgi:glycosyltransferase involved in cell wall biosynthesis